MFYFHTETIHARERGRRVQWMWMCGVSYLDEGGASSEHVVVFDDFFELREVPRVPFTHSHGEGVQVLVHLVQLRNALDDHVISTTRVEFNL